jgi:DNA-directed RNA polymerase specialized sigma24 family protein
MFGARWPVLADSIDAHLDAIAPLSIAGPVASMARLPDFNLDVVTVDEGETEVAPSIAGVWIRAWVLINWEALLPTAMPKALNEGHRAVLSRLPEDTRNAYLLHRIGGLDIEQVAWLQGVDVATGEQRLAQCLGAIARHLDAQGS